MKSHVFMVLFALAASLSAAPALAAARPGDKPFTVANFPVHATARDAVTAKEKAHADGAGAAFRSLLKRIVPVTAYNRLSRVKQTNAQELVSSVSVRSERNSGTEYIASLDYVFSAEGVRALLKREGVPFIEAQASPVTLIVIASEPVSGRGRVAKLWSAAWDGLDIEHTVTPLSIAKLDDDAAAKLARGEVDLGVASGPVVTATAGVDMASQKLKVVLTGRDAVGTISVERTYRIPQGDLAYALELAAVVALGTIEGRWKAVNAALRGGLDVIGGSGVPVNLDVEFADQSQWNDLRQQLLETPGVDDVRVDAVSARSAKVALVFPGGAEQLAEALAARGLSLRDTGRGWLLRARF